MTFQGRTLLCVNQWTKMLENFLELRFNIALNNEINNGGHFVGVVKFTFKLSIARITQEKKHCITG